MKHTSNGDLELEHKTYEDGLRDGQLKAIEAVVASHATKLEQIESRLKQQERVAYILVGAIALVQFMPAIQTFLGK